MPTTLSRPSARAAAFAAACFAPLLASAPLAAEPSDEDRLGACLTSGSTGASHSDLVSAITAVRSLCYTQIRRVRETRLQAIDASFGLPEARLTAEQRDELERARDAETRRLNDAIARVVAAHTGLTL